MTFSAHLSEIKVSLLEYLVQYTEDLLADYWLVPSGWKNLTSYPGQLNSVVLQLMPFVEYQFRVVAINRIGPSKPSKPSMHYQTRGAGQLVIISAVVRFLDYSNNLTQQTFCCLYYWND